MSFNTKNFNLKMNNIDCRKSMNFIKIMATTNATTYYGNVRKSFRKFGGGGRLPKPTFFCEIAT